MPCNSMTTQTLNAGLENAMPQVLAQALKSEGWQIHEEVGYRVVASNRYDSLTWTKGKGIVVSTSGNAEMLGAKVRQAYSKAAVSWASQRAGFKQVGQWQDNKVTLTRG